VKKCISCGIEKDESEFAQRRGKATSKCKTCHSAYYKQYYIDNPDKYEELKARTNRPEARLKARASTYDLTIEEYDVLLKSNNGMCHLCNVRKAVCTDHDHKTNKVRGRLCSTCNTGLGKLGDTLESLQAAVQYLSKQPRP
jgi:hypothetical protein